MNEKVRKAVDARLIAAYEVVGWPLMQLPYTPEMRKITRYALKRTSEMEMHEAFHRLKNLEIAGKLPVVGKTKKEGNA